MKRNLFYVAVTMDATADPDDEIDEAALEGIVRQALYSAEDGDDVKTRSISVLVIDTDVAV